MTSQPVRPSAIAEFLCNRQPLSIRRRILADTEFQERCGLTTASVVTLPDGVALPTRRLISVARKVLSGGGVEQVAVASGTNLIFSKDDQGLLVISADKGGQLAFKVALAEFSILSPDADSRESALRSIEREAGPTAPDFSSVLGQAAGGMLTDEQVIWVLNVSARGVAAAHRRGMQALNRGGATLDDLVPESMSYYEAMCGPTPSVTDPEEYIRGPLVRHRQELLKRNLRSGLPIVLMGALRDEINPAQWILQVSDDELWAAMEDAHPLKDPVSLLAAVDIALARQHDARFRDFAERGIRLLVGDESMLTGGFDTFDLMAAFASLALDRINLCEGAMLRPPYWRRMCAWMQAAVLLRLTEGFGFEPNRLNEWARETMPISARYFTAMDLRRAPMYKAAEINANGIRAEMIGRLTVIAQRHVNQGAKLPVDDDAIKRAQMGVAQRGAPLGWLLPGPLEGHIRPAAHPLRAMPVDWVKRAKRAISKNPGGREWINLSYWSQLFDLDEDLLAHLRASIPKISFGKTGRTKRAVIEHLIHGTLIAAAQRDAELSRNVVAKIFSGFDAQISEEDCDLIFKALLLAGAAFEDENQWADWLAEQLAQLAVRMQREAAQTFLSHLEALKIALPLQLQIHSRAEALARSALV